MGMRIDPGAADFPYEQIAAQLRARIETGEWPKGSKLPSLEDIVAETGVSTMTARRAWKLLEEEGLVRIVPGRGTYLR